MAEKVLINREVANELVLGYELNGFKKIHSEQVNTRRWEADYFLVIQRLSDGKLFGADYALGLTECQERAPFESWDVDKDGNIEFTEVTTKEKVITEYVYAEEE